MQGPRSLHSQLTSHTSCDLHTCAHTRKYKTIFIRHENPAHSPTLHFSTEPVAGVKSVLGVCECGYLIFGAVRPSSTAPNLGSTASDAHSPLLCLPPCPLSTHSTAMIQQYPASRVTVSHNRFTMLHCPLYGQVMAHEYRLYGSIDSRRVILLDLQLPPNIATILLAL